MKQNLLSAICLLLLPYLAYSQTEKQLDSIIQVCSKMKNDTNKVIFQNQISWSFKYSHPDLMEKLLRDNIQLSKKLKFDSGTALAYKNLGILMDEAGNMPKSIENYQLAIRYYKKANDEMGVAKSEANIGILYRDLKRNTEAIAKFRESNKIFIKNGFLQGQLIIYENLSICYEFMNKLDSATVNIKKAMEIMNELKTVDPHVYGNYANIFMKQKNYPKAIEYYEKAIEILGSDSRGITWTDNLGLAYYYQKQYPKALPLFIESIENSHTIYNANTMATHMHLANLHYAMKDYKSAFDIQRTYLEIRDSIFSVENSKQLSELTKKYDSDKKKIQIENQKRQIKSEQTQKYIFAGSMVVFIGLGFLLFRSLKQKNKATKIILEQKNIVENQKDALEFKNREILDSITYAKRLQDAILPAVDYWHKTLPESFILYKPKDIVAGDFYWLESHTVSNGTSSDEYLFFAAADCTGHGVPGAMVSVICCNALNRSVLEFDLIEPGKILDKTRELVISTFNKSVEDVKDGMDISLGCLNVRTKELLWSGANNPLWVVPAGSDEIIEWKADKQPIGTYAEEKPFKTHSMVLEPKTTIYLFTDGYADQFGGQNGKKFKYKQFKDSILAIHDRPMEEQKEHLETTFESWKGELEQVDDVCVIGIRI
ncbi:tetratricopeptide repeat protein [Fluviicola taffensis]|uniref:Protein serine/threonine phosphatase n=1 Tax=Fluviicola taffensis (strain DSM 16823 / NCIMB 13979 / RW262) TaxID=755732 RepID=F2IIQ0_FLUTR|nr:tetratricopeptide repeat protein [Fluviicola taffensis]AEA46012.1 protein serine/threonine phosphatase [Fluviicola taffensis DSM 16823]